MIFTLKTYCCFNGCVLSVCYTGCRFIKQACHVFEFVMRAQEKENEEMFDNTCEEVSPMHTCQPYSMFQQCGVVETICNIKLTFR